MAMIGPAMVGQARHDRVGLAMIGPAMVGQATGVLAIARHGFHFGQTQ